MGDNLSFGLTDYARNKMGIDGVDKNSGMYFTGDLSGTALSIAIGGAAGASKVLPYLGEHHIKGGVLCDLSE